MKSQAILLYNPNAGTASKIEELPAEIRSRFEIKKVSSKEELEDLAGGAHEEGFDVVVAAGGDGTVHSAVNGLMRKPVEKRAKLGILPLGTGNDLARTLNIPTDLQEAAKLILEGKEAHDLDVIEVTGDEGIRFAVNVCSGGFSGLVEENLTDEIKSTWGPLSYLRGAAAALPNLKQYITRVSFDDEDYEIVSAFNAIVANGQYAAKGFAVAPDANPRDGLLDIVIVLNSPLLDLAAVAARLIAGDYTESERVLFRRAKRVKVSSVPGMWFSLDGELYSKSALTFSAVQKALRVFSILPKP